MIGSISIEKYKINVSIGVYDHEKKEKQVVILDILLKVDFTKCICSDKLEEALDYDKVMELCQNIACSQHYHLIETLAAALVVAIEKRFSPLAVQVILRKELSLATAAVTLQKGEI
jgi:dihydroneopterin aldolase